MKTLKEGMFWFVIFYVIIISFLFIRQIFIVHDTMYKEIKLEKNEKYEKFIMESRVKLESYKKIATTQEEINCLNEVKKLINDSYQKQHASVSTYKAAKAYYYNNVSFGDFELKNYVNIKRTCNITNEEKNKELLKYLNANFALIEGHLVETNYMYQISLPSFIASAVKSVTKPSLENILNNGEHDIRSLIINNEINYIKTILELVGENYEVKQDI